MGAKTWMLVYSDGHPRETLRTRLTLNRPAANALAHKLFPSEGLTPLKDGSLARTNPADDEIVIGCLAGVSVVAAREFGIECPSQLPSRFVLAGGAGAIHLHASVVDWFAFAVWRAGRLERSLSLSPDSGVLEDIGARTAFEMPYWAGEHPAVDPNDEDDAYPFPWYELGGGLRTLSCRIPSDASSTITTTVRTAGCSRRLILCGPLTRSGSSPASRLAATTPLSRPRALPVFALQRSAVTAAVTDVMNGAIAGLSR